MDDRTIKLALLGDKASQERLTDRGELLPCPFCGGKAEAKTQKQQYGLSGTIIRCRHCLSSVYCLDKCAQITENGIKNVPINNHVFLASYRWNARTPILSSREIEMLNGKENP